MGLRIALTHVFSWPEVRRGGERYLHELGSALADAGHRPLILSTSPQPSRARVLGVDVRYLRRRHLLRRPFGTLSSELAFGAQSLMRLAPRGLDAWHALGTADAAAAAVLGSVRDVRSVYTDLGIPNRAWRNTRPDTHLHRFVVSRVDNYVCLSNTAGAVLRQDYGREPTVLGGGVDIRRFAPAGRRASAPTLLFAGALEEPRKNLRLLLHAVALLRRHQSSVELWLCGPGDARPLLEEAPAAAREAVRVKDLGDPSTLSALYGSAWVTVLPSIDEAFGLVLVESLACGTPIVTLAGGGPAEIVRDGLGATCEPTVDALADACRKALELASIDATTEACRAEAERYDWRRSIIPRLEALYVRS
jgi:glycosyltransferase involved in cell wall biosynthesis